MIVEGNKVGNNVRIKYKNSCLKGSTEIRNRDNTR
jgi:hypothetical protein